MNDKKRPNFELPNQMTTPVKLDALEKWAESEIAGLDKELQPILLQVCGNLDYFVRWSHTAELLWKGCYREKYHTYPEELKKQAKQAGLTLNTLSNGPAIVSYVLARGERPKRHAKNSEWTIHHIYFNQFPHFESEKTLHAIKEGNHFTQSAGLVAIHPIADALCDEYPLFSWLLRAKAFQKFGYDPDHVFTREPIDEYGFAPGYSTIVHYTAG